MKEHRHRSYGCYAGDSRPNNNRKRGSGGGGGSSSSSKLYRGVSGRAGVLNTDTFANIVVRGAPEAEGAEELYYHDDAAGGAGSGSEDARGIGGGGGSSSEDTDKDAVGAAEGEGQGLVHKRGSLKSKSKKRRKTNGNTTSLTTSSSGSGRADVSSTMADRNAHAGSSTAESVNRNMVNPLECNGPGYCTKVFCFSCASAPDPSF